MKFLTKEVYDSWYDGFEDEGPMNAATQAYRDHLAKLTATLPEPVRLLGKLYRAPIDVPSGTLVRDPLPGASVGEARPAEP